MPPRQQIDPIPGESIWDYLERVEKAKGRTRGQLYWGPAREGADPSMYEGPYTHAEIERMVQEDREPVNVFRWPKGGRPELLYQIRPTRKRTRRKSRR